MTNCVNTAKIKESTADTRLEYRMTRAEARRIRNETIAAPVEATDVAAVPGHCLRADIDKLPWDMLGEILGRLVPELVAFGSARCVCKAWNQVMTSTAVNKQGVPLWCVFKFTEAAAGWTCRDVSSGKEYRFTPPAGTGTILRHCDIPKGQCGLLLFCNRRDGTYVLVNPLLKRWKFIHGDRRLGQSTHELVVADRHGLGSGSSTRYRIVRFQNTKSGSPRHGRQCVISVQVFDSQSQAWTTGPSRAHGLGKRVELRSCVWGSNSVFLLVIASPLRLELHREEFSVWEYKVDQDTLSIKVPMASIPTLDSLWFEYPSEDQIHVQLIDGNTVQLVAQIGFVSPRVEVYTWDPSLESWIRCGGEAVAQPCKYPEDLSGPLDPEVGLLGGKVMYSFAGSLSDSRPRIYSSSLFVTRTDTLDSRWYCDLGAPADTHMRHTYRTHPAFCFFPSLDAVP